MRLGDGGRRLRLTVVCFGFVLSLFAGRLLQLQGFDAKVYASEAVSDRLVTVALPATRGTIQDTHGVALATSVEAVELVADQTLVTDARTGASPATAAAQLSPLVGVPVDLLTARLTGTKHYVVLAHQLTPQVYARVRALHLPGVLSAPSSTRVYPAGTVAAGVVGWLAKDGTPLGGLELARNGELKGRPGTVTYEAAAGNRLPGDSVGTPARPGTTVVTSIDRDVQFVAEQTIASKVKETGAEWGAVVVLDVRTGRVLVMANAPNFNPNSANKAAPEDLKNRAIEDAFEPGSTSKVVTMSAAIQEGKVTPSTPIADPWFIHRSTAVFHDDVQHATKTLTVTGVLAESSNVGTIQVGEKLAPPTLYDYLRKFGLAQKTDIGLPGETKGILAPVDEWSGTSRYTISFGQGLASTLLQQAGVYQTIANKGVRIAPTLVSASVGPDRTRVPAPLGAKTTVVSPTTAATLLRMLETVVNDGTGVYAQIPGYRIAGKTGTAQIPQPGCGYRCGSKNKFQASFIGVVPADAPRFVVAVTLRDPKGRLHFGGYNGGPVFKVVASLLLKNYAVAPSGTTAPVAKLTVP